MNNELISILCPNRSYLAPLKMMGPIVQPMTVERSTVIALLMAGADVYKYNLATRESVRLILDDFVSDKKVVETKEPPKVDTSINTGEVSTKFDINEYPFVYDENGLVDESAIDWTILTRAQKKELRAKIGTINEKAKEVVTTSEGASEEPPKETPEE